MKNRRSKKFTMTPEEKERRKNIKEIQEGTNNRIKFVPKYKSDYDNLLGNS